MRDLQNALRHGSSISLFAALSATALATGGCSSDLGGTDPSTPASAASQGSGAPSGDGPGAALADDGVEGITGCSGIYGCRVRNWSSGDEEISDQEIVLRVVEGECWANEVRLMADGTAKGKTDRDAFWVPREGGLDLHVDKSDMECSTKTGSSKSGPKLTAPYCQGEDLSCLGEETEAGCRAAAPACSWSSTGNYCFGGPVPCYAQLSSDACARVKGCSWK